MNSTYRPDIDGLRAVAVLSVVAYHINKSWLPGGYVGVDIFFVISGFLITRIIWNELQQDRFSLIEFYMRRIRRIAPAFFAMTIVVLLAGAFLLLPEDLARLAKSSIWASLSAANIYFWRHLDTSYFADSSEEEPLLHTWSLGVEEQFYLLWPALLILVARSRHRRRMVVWLTAAICVASFAYGELINTTSGKFAYFMLPARAGELMIGALLALVPQRAHGQSTRSVVVSTTLGLAGLALLAFSLFWLNDASPFPGVNAIYPCVGSVLLMIAGERSPLIRSLLGFRPMVYIGLISYSLYLWHWPILAFARYFYGGITPTMALAAVIAMLALATLSYRFVEQPARHASGTRLVQAARLFGAPALVIAVIGGYIWTSNGMKHWIESSSAYRDGLARLEADTAPPTRFDYVCQLFTHDPSILEQSRCVLGDAPEYARQPRILLWGDSHASHYAGVASVMAKAQGVAIRNATHSACPPVINGDYGNGVYRAGCSKFRPYVFASIARGDYDLVLMGGNWSAYENLPGFRADLEHTLDAITAGGTRVALLAEVPKFPNYNRECDMRWSRLGHSACNQLAVADSDSAINGYLHGLATHNDRISFLGVRDAICTSGSCRPYLQGHPVYFDRSHLSMNGSWRVGEAIAGTSTASEWAAVLRGQHVIAGLGGTSRATGTLVTSAIAAERPAGQTHFRPTGLDTPFPEGFELGIPFNKLFENTVREGGHYSHRVMVEYLGWHPEEVEETLARSLEHHGFVSDERTASVSETRLQFSRGDGATVSLSIRSHHQAEKRAPNASGILHLTWNQ